MEVIITEKCKKHLHRLLKKYISIEKDLLQLVNSLEQNPFQGDALGKNCYKIRFPITSKGYGKSYGARAITCVKITENNIFLLTIYDKSDKKDISDKELISLLKEAGLKQ